eukprot:Skav224737  [mRNA]  locus=scaffold3343:41840:42256:+ [translate_table: standard]
MLLQALSPTLHHISRAGGPLCTVALVSLGLLCFANLKEEALVSGHIAFNGAQQAFNCFRIADLFEVSVRVFHLLLAELFQVIQVDHNASNAVVHCLLQQGPVLLLAILDVIAKVTLVLLNEFLDQGFVIRSLVADFLG